MSEIKEIIKQLVEQLNTWSKAYYVENRNIVSDQEYDAAYNQLVKLEEEYPELIQPDSPTQRAGDKLDKRFEKVKHQYPMLSLGNAYNEQDVLDFDAQIKRELNLNNEIQYVTELKIDGLSISLLYSNGKLVKALTRGDGTTGEDVTHNVLMIEDIPKVITDLRDLEFRGEIYMKKSVFNSLNEIGEKLANPRNGAAGSLRQLDSSVAKRRQLSSFIYSIPNALQLGLKTHIETLSFIKSLGFATNEEASLNQSASEVNMTITKLTDIRHSLDYEIDGIVIKVNDMRLWEDIGYTIKAPKFMIAYKFPEEVAQSTLVAIFPTIGRTGRVTYNARLKAVRLAGTTVTAATLHNADYVREININVGDVVLVKKAAEIIPKVLGVAIKNNNDSWEEATECPACLHKLYREEGEVDQYCINEECPQKNIARLEHFTSRKAMEIENLSIKTIESFIQEGLITDIPSIFELVNKKEQILALPGWKDKSATNLLNAINKAKKQDLGRFIFALGIRHVGEKASKTLASRFGSLDKIISSTKEEIENIRELGPAVAESIVSYFADEANIKMLKELIDHGITFNEIKGPSSNILGGQTFVITGTLSKPRDFFKGLIESNGGNVSSAVSKNTSYLLAGEEAGSKLDKAKEIGVKIINENELNALIGDKDE